MRLTLPTVNSTTKALTRLKDEKNELLKRKSLQTHKIRKTRKDKDLKYENTVLENINLQIKENSYYTVVYVRLLKIFREMDHASNKFRLEHLHINSAAYK